MTKKRKYLKHKRALKRALNEVDAELGGFEPTITDIEKWFDILNKGAFKGEVRKPEFVIRRYMKKANGDGQWGEAQGWIDEETNEILLLVYLTHKYPNEKMLINTIAHEMVHLYTFQQDGSMNHGRVFKRWAHIFKKLDIRL